MADSSIVRAKTLLVAMEAMRDKKRATQRELCEMTDMTYHTVNRYTVLLQAGGWIKPVAHGPKPSRGCSPIVWEWVG